MLVLLADILYAYEFHHDQKDFTKLVSELLLWKIKRVTIIDQKDGCSCGLIAFIFVVLLSFRVDLDTFDKKQIICNDMMTNLRTKLASSILCEKLFFSTDYVNNINGILSDKINTLWKSTIESKITAVEDIINKKKEGNLLYIFYLLLIIL